MCIIFSLIFFILFNYNDVIQMGMFYIYIIIIIIILIEKVNQNEDKLCVHEYV